MPSLFRACGARHRLQITPGDVDDPRDFDVEDREGIPPGLPGGQLVFELGPGGFVLHGIGDGLEGPRAAAVGNPPDAVPNAAPGGALGALMQAFGWNPARAGRQPRPGGEEGHGNREAEREDDEAAQPGNELGQPQVPLRNLA